MVHPAHRDTHIDLLVTSLTYAPFLSVCLPVLCAAGRALGEHSNPPLATVPFSLLYTRSQGRLGRACLWRHWRAPISGPRTPLLLQSVARCEHPCLYVSVVTSLCLPMLSVPPLSLCMCAYGCQKSATALGGGVGWGTSVAYAGLSHHTTLPYRARAERERERG
jgi:hypothetical protein